MFFYIKYNKYKSDKIFQRSFCDLLVYFHSHYNLVEQIFEYLYNDTKEKILIEITSYLTYKFHYIAYNFELCLTNAATEKMKKKNALLSLGEIIRFLGTEKITNYCFKILALIKNVLNMKEEYLYEDLLEVLSIFLRIADVSDLGSLLSSVVLTLIPLKSHFEDKINEILKSLFDRHLLSEYFGDLFFIDELDVPYGLKKNIKKYQKNTETSPISEVLGEYSKHLKHENLTIKIYALKYLLKIFRENKTKLNRLILSFKVADPIISNIIEALMSCCKEKHENVQILAAECLGELGALEPSHIPPTSQTKTTFAFSVKSDEFAKMVLKELCRAYQLQSIPGVLNCLAFAIQEVLQIHQVDLKKSSKTHIWEAVPIRMRPLVEPLLKSNLYDVESSVEVKPHPIYCSTSNFNEWSFIWANKMIAMLPNSDNQKLLKAFKPSIKNNTNLLSTIFPYIVLHAIESGSNLQVNEIFEEINIVLKNATVKRQEQKLNKPSREGSVLHFPNEKSIVSTVEENCINNYNYNNETKVQKCVKICFDVIDFLERWKREYHGRLPSEFKTTAGVSFNI